MSGDDEFDDLDDYIDDFVTAQVLDGVDGQENGPVPNEIDRLVEEIESKIDNAPPQTFRSILEDTKERIKESEETVDKSAETEAPKDEELLATLLKSLDIDGDFEGGDLFKMLNESGEGGGDIGDLLTEALGKLTGKEMLYDTISDSCLKYEGYFKENPKPTTGDGLSDYLRYEAQYNHLSNIKQRFESENYSDSNDSDREFVDSEMEKFNNLYPPPAGVISDDLNAMGVEGLKFGDKDVPFDERSLEEGCQQV